MTLASIGGNPALMDKLAGMKNLTGPISDLLEAFKRSDDTKSATDKLEGVSVDADTEGANTVMVFGKDGQGTFRRFWIRKSDRLVLKPTLANAEHVVFAATLPSVLPGEQNEMYFYTHGGSELYRYTLEGKYLTPKTTLVKIPYDFGPLENVVVRAGQDQRQVQRAHDSDIRRPRRRRSRRAHVVSSRQQRHPVAGAAREVRSAYRVSFPEHRRVAFSVGGAGEIHVV